MEFQNPSKDIPELHKIRDALELRKGWPGYAISEPQNPSTHFFFFSETSIGRIEKALKGSVGLQYLS